MLSLSKRKDETLTCVADMLDRTNRIWELFRPQSEEEVPSRWKDLILV